LFTYNNGITFKNCVFDKFKSALEGSAIFINTGSNTVLDTCTISNCTTYKNGAVRSYQGVLTITNCLFSNNSVPTPSSGSGGAAICADASLVSQGITVTNSIFRNNKTYVPVSGIDAIGGGAIRCKVDPGTCIVNGCVFEGNEAYYAGGMYVSSGGATATMRAVVVQVTNCTFQTNIGRYGILFFSGVDGIINRCYFQENYLNQHATIYLRYGQPKVYNTVVHGNKSDHYAAGIYMNAVEEGAKISGVTVACNYGADGVGIGIIGGSIVDVYNSIFWGNVSSLWGNAFYIEGATLRTHYCCYPNGVANGVVDVKIVDGSTPTSTLISDNDIHTDPLFVNQSAVSALLNPNRNGDFNLQAGSPCLNAGVNANVYGTLDYAGNPRIANTTVDLGAYEKQ
jgi:hypothetical protein